MSDSADSPCEKGYRQVLLGLGNLRTVKWTAHDIKVGDFIKHPQPFYSWNWRDEYWEVLEVYGVKDG